MNSKTELRRMCRELNLTQLEFAIEIGISPRMMDYYLCEQCKNPPKKVIQSARYVYRNKTGKEFE